MLNGLLILTFQNFMLYAGLLSATSRHRSCPSVKLDSAFLHEEVKYVATCEILLNLERLF